MSNKEVLSRFGVSMLEELMVHFDQYIEQQGYSNRSEAIRNLIRNALLEPVRLQSEQMVAGTIVMVYDHHARELPADLTELQHHYHKGACLTD